MKTLKLNATDARAMFPGVVGTINGATLYSGFAVLDMGPKSFGVMVRGEFVACCPSLRYAKRAGERHANRANECDAVRFGDACAVCAAEVAS